VGNNRVDVDYVDYVDYVDDGDDGESCTIKELRNQKQSRFYKRSGE
jgi:hypothetical protein